ncbi:ClpXP protease specificity-enhancing factor [Colwellia sp. BRX10-3]|uniref:ClpXP protease specificity-enhancing factor n=1 Tax=Colwellia sp. BRX10-3 TaxID=2759844 RepID=UPI0015F61784|nr:ClpXP protease specificity-enhancing factor [Colwellia sp. BRX10-3]MBA6389775.1 ClpXP protease specificity-enhancing factor [Colwellia sp. BRX10-3]
MTSEMTSSKPYIVKAFYDWISDNGLTPYIVVDVNVYGVMVPMSYVNDGQIVLNVSPSAVGSIVMGEETIELSARFGGKLEHMSVPYGAVGAIYAKENGAGTSLAIEHPSSDDIAEVPEQPSVKMSSVKAVDSKADTKVSDKKQSTKASKSKKPSLSVVKK